MKAYTYNKLSFDIKRFVIQKMTPCEAMILTLSDYPI